MMSAMSETPNLEARTVAPQDIRTVWSVVRPWVIHVAMKTGERYLPDDVFASIVTGRAWLFVFENETKITGCIILERNVCYGDPEMNVWIAYHNDPGVTIGSYWNWLVRTAKDAGCKRITFKSNRPLDRVVPVKRRLVEFEAEV